MAGLVVVGAVAVARTKDGSERYLYRGTHFDSAGYDEKNLTHLRDAGLIEKVKVAEKTEGTDPDAMPDGDPTEAWSLKQLDAWGAKQDPVVKFGANQNKTERLEQIAKLKAADQS